MKTLTRKQIIRALRTEPLEGGQWIRPKDVDLDRIPYEEEMEMWKKPVIGTECTVCAVGAVFRTILNNPTLNDIRNAAHLNTYGENLANLGGSPTLKSAREYVQDDLNNENYLSALSGYFETLYWNVYKIKQSKPLGRGAKMKALRERLVTFVKENFPKQIKVEL